ncbi:YceI family protein [Sphingobium sp. B12D2B]|uniref:YceI family protein n=1 Tax=Sphingobium sp. B12D2B TaxID=2940577 RepID=UPI002224C448|nr:YceI family protein [Sphingobium sp. B12D2B]MCW2348928.1 cytochrome b561/polyisoprenoid-binding protein YceI [Sphingobium sp. B12D2B]
MSLHQSPARYSLAAIILHWLLAALLLFQVSLGWRLEDLTGLPQFAAYQLHKTIGISILLLSVARLMIRLLVPRPRPLNTSLLLAALAGGVHALFYVVMILGPLTGWIIVSTSAIKVPTLLFGVIPWPHLPVSAALHDPAEAVHSLLGWLLAGLVILHVAGALRHHFLRKDTLGRMVPSALSRRGALNVVAGLAIAGALTAFALAWVLPFGGKAPAQAEAGLAGSNVAVADNAGDPAVNASNAVEDAVAVNQAAAPADEPAKDEAQKAAAWTVQRGGTLNFRTAYSGSDIDGGFSRWDADIVFSPDDLPGSRIAVTVDLASVDSADSQRDEMLRGDEFFGVSAHPRATFRATRITHRDGNRYRATGTLSLNGQQKPVTLDFTLDIDGTVARARGTTRIDRTAFGVGTREWSDTSTIPDAVTISFNFQAKRAE